MEKKKERETEMHMPSSMEAIGGHFGCEAADHITRRAEDYCASAKKHIELANESRINALHCEGTFLLKAEHELEERKHRAAPPGDARSRRRQAQFNWFVGILLAVGAFFFCLIAFDPWQLGWKAYLYCASIAVVTPFAVEVFLDAYKSERLWKAVVTIVVLSALTGSALLAVVRGDLFAHQVQEQQPTIVIDGGDPASGQSPNSFYEETQTSLRALMVLIAIAIDVGSGLAIYRARLLGTNSGEDYKQLCQELAVMGARKAAIVAEITALTNAPAAFETSFWRDFYRAMITQTDTQAARKGLGRMAALGLCLLFLGQARAFAQTKLNLVVAIDLSRSVAVGDSNQTTEFKKNLDSVTRLVARLPAGSKVTIIGITDNSFAQPDILLTAAVDRDEGYFKERLAAARRQVDRAWKERAARLRPEFLQTDILGSLLVAGELFKEAPDTQKVLIIFSDMRQQTPAFGLERPAILPRSGLLARVERQRLLANLNGVAVYALGVDSASKSVAYWTSLRDFWGAYFQRAGGVLKAYSVLRDLPDAASLQ